MWLVPDDRHVTTVLGVEVEAFSKFAGIIIGKQAGHLDAQGVGEKKAGDEAVGGLARAGERAVPDLSGLEDPGGAEKAREAGDFGAATRAKRTDRILLLIEGVGVAHEVEQHGGIGATEQ